MENTEEIYTDFARVYDELMDSGFRAESGGGSGLRHRHFDRTVIPKRV